MPANDGKKVRQYDELFTLSRLGLRMRTIIEIDSRMYIDGNIDGSESMAMVGRGVARRV